MNFNPAIFLKYISQIKLQLYQEQTQQGIPHNFLEIRDNIIIH